MSDLKLSDIITMQNELQERYKGKWTPLTPENGKTSLLWMIEEIGEVISIIKKRGEEDIMDNEKVRMAFIEELSDVIMYYSAVLISYGISSEELSEIFIKKHLKNMGRDFEEEYKKMFT